MQNLKQSRLRRAKQTRLKIAKQGIMRLTIYRTNQHIYAQLIDDKNHRTIASASTVEPEVKKEVTYGSNVEAAALIGKRIADKALKEGVTQIAFDRSGYKYHGRIKALADAARTAGLKF